MSKAKPNVGDIWKSNWIRDDTCYWLILEKYIDKSANTHFLTMKNLYSGHTAEFALTYIRDKWEFIS